MPYDSEFKSAEENVRTYGDDLRKYLDKLSEAIELFNDERMELRYDEELFTDCIGAEITIVAHILPKLEGGGDKTKSLYAEMKVYEPWLDDVMIPKMKEKDRVVSVMNLYRLILRAYDMLGLTPL
jgi:hypothetical protein